MAMLTAGMASLYLAMRTVGLEHDGSCVSGGPYAIAPGHECQDGVFGSVYAAVFLLMAGFFLFLWSAHRYGGPLIVTSMSGLSAAGFFGGLGGSFLSIGNEMPDVSDQGSEFKTVGIVFLVLGFVSLSVAFGPILYAKRNERLDYRKPTTIEWVVWFATISLGIMAGLAAVGITRNFWG